MGRRPCCAKEGLNRGAWTTVEDKKLVSFITAHGEGQWRSLPKRAGLKRCGKSCRLRWLNYLRPDIKRGNISAEEEDLIIRLHNLLGNRWSLIAGRLPGRTDNEIKNYWNTTLAKKAKADSNSRSTKENSPPPRTKRRSKKSSVTSATATPGPLVIRTKATRLTRVPVIPSVPLHADDYKSNFDATNSHFRDASNTVIHAAVTGDDVDAKEDYDLPFGEGLLNDWTANDDSDHLENYGALFDFDSLAFLLDSEEWLGQENS